MALSCSSHFVLPRLPGSSSSSSAYSYYYYYYYYPSFSRTRFKPLSAHLRPFSVTNCKLNSLTLTEKEKEKQSGFSSLNLSQRLSKRLQEEGFNDPTQVQTSAIPTLLQGHDAAVQSYTGSGKTLAYLLPMLSKIGPLKEDVPGSQDNASKGGVEAVVVAPSRELAMQIVREAEKILGPEHRRAVQQLIGGANQKRQEEALKKNKPPIVVGTPGRISEVSRAGKLHTHACQFLVLDEADQLLSSKYRNDMQRILEHVGQRRTSMQGAEVSQSSSVGHHPGLDAKSGQSENGRAKKASIRVQRQTILVSATMPRAVLRAASEWGHKPLLVRASQSEIVDLQNRHAEKEDALKLDNSTASIQGVQESLPPNLQHFYILAPAQHRVDTLRKCIHALNAQSVIVFMNFTKRLKDTVFKLDARGLVAGSLHGELGKMERANVLAAFRGKRLRVIVISEVGARGLDIPECDLVVNLELPTDGIHYAHRAGRTGRLGRKGTIISICEQREEFVFRKFERQLDISIQRCDVLEGKLILHENLRLQAMGYSPALMHS